MGTNLFANIVHEQYIGIYIYTHVSVYNSNLLGMLNNVHQQFNPWAIINYSQYISTFAGIVLGIFVNMGISDIGYNNKCIYIYING